MFSYDIEEIQPPFTTVETDIVWDADWRDALPKIWEADGVPLNLTGKTLTIYIKPTYGYVGAMTSFASPTFIVFDDAVNGLASMAVPRATVQSQLVVGSWWHFCVLTEGTNFTELWRGPFTVHAGELDVTP